MDGTYETLKADKIRNITTFGHVLLLLVIWICCPQLTISSYFLFLFFQKEPLHNSFRECTRTIFDKFTTDQNKPLLSDHLQSTTTSNQRPPPINDHLQSTTTSNQRPLPINDHLQSTTTSNQRPLPINDHLQSTTTSNQRPPPINDHLQSTTTSNQRPLPINDHLKLAKTVAATRCSNIYTTSNIYITLSLQ